MHFSNMLLVAQLLECTTKLLKPSKKKKKKRIGLDLISGAEIGVVIHDIHEMLRRSKVSAINFVSRLANNVAHSLAKLALAFEGESVWLEDCPLAVEHLVWGDCPSAL